MPSNDEAGGSNVDPITGASTVSELFDGGRGAVDVSPDNAIPVVDRLDTRLDSIGLLRLLPLVWVLEETVLPMAELLKAEWYVELESGRVEAVRTS